MPPLDAGEHPGQVFETRQIVPRQEPVDVRQRRLASSVGLKVVSLRA